jgi:hypothetical protein
MLTTDFSLCKIKGQFVCFLFDETGILLKKIRIEYRVTKTGGDNFVC